MDGVINLDKPPHMTSARVVSIVKRLLPRGTKVGHAGTLDSFATGVLLLLVGKTTRKCELLMSLPKVYHATIKLGATTATDDPESPERVYTQDNSDILHTMESRGDSDHTFGGMPLSVEQLNSAIAQFKGEILQRPPIYSALKVAGRRSSDYARRGKAVAVHPRPVQIYSFTLTGYEWPFAKVRVECGRGTYIRSLARDLGQALRVGGYVAELRRTRIGTFDVERAATLSQLQTQPVEDFLITF
jgi:tRNA pseudouridine55 synthase